MLIFWWTGKGYQTALSVLLTLMLCGFVLQASKGFFEDGPVFWGLATILAVPVNWHFGTKANQKRLSKVQPQTIRHRLIYNAPHRFMWLPMETFSIVIAAIGIILVVSGLVRPA